MVQVFANYGWSAGSDPATTEMLLAQTNGFVVAVDTVEEARVALRGLVRQSGQPLLYVLFDEDNTVLENSKMERE